MITFETQEDFEDAVMQVLHKRLIVEVRMKSSPGWAKVEVTLKEVRNAAQHFPITDAWDSISVEVG